MYLAYVMIIITTNQIQIVIYSWFKVGDLWNDRAFLFYIEILIFRKENDRRMTLIKILYL